MTMNRRDLFRRAALGSVGAAVALEQLGGVPMLGNLFDHWASGIIVNPYDAYTMMGNALAGGRALLGVHKAMAAAEDDWALVQIKVCNHVHTPLVFKLGKLENGNVTVDASKVKDVSTRLSTTKNALVALGVDQISGMPRYQALRFNKWFANILHNGSADGNARTTANLNGLAADDVADFSADKVALQVFMGLQQVTTNNHSLKGLKLRDKLPDVALFALDKQVIKSPLGISCFMMGNKYDKAEGSLSENAVLGAGGGETAIVTSRTVNAYAGQIQQFVGKSYADRSSVEQNTVYKLDQLVQKDPKLRRELLGSIEQFKVGLTKLTAAAELEKRLQTPDTTIGNTQSVTGIAAGSGASCEFLAQCKYVANSLDLPGMPVRSYSLFLNASDLDGNNLDIPFDGGAVVGAGVKAYTYIEAMRQLAMGLNILGKKIAEGKKVIVLVTSEGGRGAMLQDSLTSFALVLGPKGAGGLDDMLYAKMSAINAESGPAVEDPAQAAAAMPWDVEGLKAADGSPAAATDVPNTGDVQLGVVEFFEEKSGRSDARKGLTAAEGRFVKLKRAS